MRENVIVTQEIEVEFYANTQRDGLWYVERVLDILEQALATNPDLPHVLKSVRCVNVRMSPDTSMNPVRKKA